MRKMLFIVGLLVAAFVTLLVARVGIRNTRILADTVTIKFAAYTNDSSGNRLAVFKITNPGSIAIDLKQWHDVQVESTNGWKSQGLTRAASAVVWPGQSTFLEIPAPGSTQRWRVWLNYEDHTDFAADCLLLLKRIGLPAGFQNRAYSACSDTINP
jgi:hypothetical protein